uniref:Uncharacterized protein n=1 Tax=Lepeophtheirus salmonis TaxID=72036 RepID=A0A0K2TLJ6_LEPSM
MLMKNAWLTIAVEHFGVQSTNWSRYDSLINMLQIAKILGQA